jgi:alanyl aminopeptidase
VLRFAVAVMQREPLQVRDVLEPIEQLVLIDPKKPSWRQRRSFVGVTAHELAHQWFGDYVTMAWWDDIWLNEGFATWLGNKIVARFKPAWHDELGELDLRMGELEADSVVSARKIRQPIEKLDDIYNAFDGITYTKGAAVLNTFEQYVGPDVFQTGVREYLKSRAWGNATSTDFVAAVSKAAGKDLVTLMEAARVAIPAQRFGDPEEFGAVCAFMCSVQASYLVGQNILLDGGSYPGTF